MFVLLGGGSGGRAYSWRWRFAAIMAVMLAGPMTPASGQAQQNAAEQKRTVVVTGRGPTVAEAQKDAVREALQQVVKQLVFMERRIENDKLVRNRIMSTMNGYVDGLRVLRKEHKPAEGMFTMEAEITVSTSRIVNFLASTAGASAGLQGGLLSADASREIGQREVRGLIFDRLLTGLPGSAIELFFGSPLPDERDPTQFVFPVTARLSAAWLASLRTGLQALSIGQASEEGRNAESRSSSLAMHMQRRQGPVGSSAFCMTIRETRSDCFLLPPGDYGRTTMIGRQESQTTRFESPHLLLALRFVNAAGASTIVAGRPCLVRELVAQRRESTSANGRRGFTAAGRIRLIRENNPSHPLDQRYRFSTDEVVGTVTIKAAEVDLASSVKYAAVAVFGARQFSGYTSMHSGNIRPPFDDPGLLFVPDVAAAAVSRARVCGEMLDDAMLARRTR